MWEGQEGLSKDREKCQRLLWKVPKDKFGMTYWHKNALLKQFVEKFFAEGV